MHGDISLPDATAYGKIDSQICKFGSAVDDTDKISHECSDSFMGRI